VCLPAALSWPDFDTAARKRGLVVGGSYGQLADKVFRLGHMGSQAEKKLVTLALDAIAEILKDVVR
jgi:aspartate aminotransferase-like enzyme